MTATVIIALLLVLAVYLSIGISQGRRTKNIADLLPFAFNGEARVNSTSEFYASTVATTVSLATVIMAFFELARHLGIWLLWAAITTAAGLFVVQLFAKRIWQRMSAYDHRPTLHEFLGTEFNSELVRYVGAGCASLGFLGAFAVELTVGSKFFAGLVEGVPSWSVIVVLSVVVFGYTALGGFRAVIISDKIQMISIWLLLFCLPGFYIYYVAGHGGWAANFKKIPPEIFDLSYSVGLIPFLLGIFAINVPTFISDMGLWQRIGGTQKKETVIAGLWASIFGSAATWVVLVLLACFVFMMVDPTTSRNPLLSLMGVIGTSKGMFGVIVLFFTVLGLYGAMLSTAATQLIAVSHTLYADVFVRIRKRSLTERANSKREIRISRSILVVAAVMSTVLVQLLSNRGFSIVDLIFAIYGAQLGLCPLVISALLLDRERLKNISAWAAVAVSAGFVTGWGVAIAGRFTGNTNLVFLAPVCSLFVSSVLVGVGFLVSKNKTVLS